MKIKITLLMLAAVSVLRTNAQVALSEDFASGTLPTGWSVQNNSVPTGGLATWFQGNPGAFTAYNGGPDEYIAANFQSVPAGTGDISTWLFTPTVTIMNGAILQFATRGTNITPAKADRLEVRMSTDAAGGFAVPTTGTATVGSYTTTLFNINQTLSPTGYPQVWTIFTVQISNVTGAVPGKFAFRYFVPNGGDGGTNSLYIGVDAVKYTLPCGPTAQSFTTCAGVSTTLNAVGGLPATTYSWSGPASFTANTQSIVVTAPPSGTAVYTLFPSVNGTVSCGVSQTATVTVGANLSMNITQSSSTVCVGRTLTLTAVGGATAYSWSNGATTQSTVVIPNLPTTYSVTGTNGSCTGTASISVTPVTNPTLNATFSPTAICPSSTFVATGSGALVYSWQLSANNSVAGSTVSLVAPANAGTPQFTLNGTAANGCTSSKVIVLTVNPKPVVTGFLSRDIVCTKDTVTMVGEGATTYTWSISGATNSNNPRIYTTTANVNHNLSILLSGSQLGCKSVTVTLQLDVDACTGIEKFSGSGEASIYPNPFANELKLSGLAGKVEIYNALGQSVITVQSGNTETINTSSLPKGIYILKSYNEQGSLTKAVKLLKD